MCDKVKYFASVCLQTECVTQQFSFEPSFEPALVSQAERELRGVRTMERTTCGHKATQRHNKFASHNE